MEGIDYGSVVSPGSIEQSPISVTTTDVNFTGNWKFFRPLLEKENSPCMNFCPLNIDIASYFFELNNNNISRALHILRQANPIPATLGRICPHFCLQGCNRSKFDEAVSIGDIELYLGDKGLNIPYSKPNKWGKHNVAIIGSGPAGIAAAYYLSKSGVNTTIFEKEVAAGGLLRYGIPSYRLPKDILDAELNNLIRSLKIEIINNKEIKNSDLSLLLKDYNFVFSSLGLEESIVPDNFLKNPKILKGLSVLNSINKGEIPNGEIFAIVGGGNVAVDVARSLLRLGKKVEIIYRRTYEEMPSYRDEKEEMRKEGIRLRERVLVSKAENYNGKLHLTLVEALNEAGSFKEGKIIGVKDVDFLIMAIGQKTSIKIPANNRILVGGDYLIGASSVAESIATAKKAAINILEILENYDYVKTLKNYDSDKKVINIEQLNLDYIKKSKAINVEYIDVEERIKSFIPVRGKPSEKEIIMEVQRCLNCGKCTGCGICWFFCPDIAISMSDIEKELKVMIDEEHCKGCGLCSKSCPRGVIKMEENL